MPKQTKTQISTWCQLGANLVPENLNLVPTWCQLGAKLGTCSKVYDWSGNLYAVLYLSKTISACLSPYFVSLTPCLVCIRCLIFSSLSIATCVRFPSVMCLCRHFFDAACLGCKSRTVDYPSAVSRPAMYSRVLYMALHHKLTGLPMRSGYRMR